MNIVYNFILDTIGI